jgi:hypothetical protein
MGKPQRVRLVATDEQGIVRGACLVEEEEAGEGRKAKERHSFFSSLFFKPSLAIKSTSSPLFFLSISLSSCSIQSYTVVEAPALTQLDAMEAVARW